MYQQIIDFWFKEIEPACWWKKDPDFDERIKQDFYDLHQQASHGELFEWRQSPIGSLAEIIILDQFSRNIYRDKAKSFAYDGMAILLAQRAIEKRFDLPLNPAERSFLYMPFMHSESASIHAYALTLYTQQGLEHNLEFELKHKVIIDGFGRYPHRNKILGRTSTPQEIAFLKEPNSSF